MEITPIEPPKLTAQPTYAARLAPLTSNVGAEVFDLDLCQPQSDETIAFIRHALFEWGVIFFRDQSLTVEQYVDFGRRLGELEEKATMHHVEGHPQVGLLVKDADHVTSVGDMWHTDHTYMAHPISFTMLHAIEVPPYGGDTLFAHAGRSFATLPEGTKDTLRGMKALHSRSYLIKDGKYKAQYLLERPPSDADAIRDARMIHPVVTRHPETGEEILFVNPGYVVKFDGWTAELSKGLLAALYDHCLQPEYQCRFRWQKNSIAMWDNRLVWHCALNDYHGHRRVMHRMMIA